MSPTQRTLRALRDRGYFAEVVERWNPHAGIRLDLFRWIDVIAVKPGEPFLGVQTTTGANAAARVKKAQGNAALSSWIRAGGILAVFAWAKHKRRLTSGRWSNTFKWVLREVPIRIKDVEKNDGTHVDDSANRAPDNRETKNLWGSKNV